MHYSITFELSERGLCTGAGARRGGSRGGRHGRRGGRNGRRRSRRSETRRRRVQHRQGKVGRGRGRRRGKGRRDDARGLGRGRGRRRRQLDAVDEERVAVGAVEVVDEHELDPVRRRDVDGLDPRPPGAVPRRHGRRDVAVHRVGRQHDARLVGRPELDPERQQVPRAHLNVVQRAEELEARPVLGLPRPLERHQERRARAARPVVDRPVLGRPGLGDLKVPRCQTVLEVTIQQADVFFEPGYADW